MTTQAEPENPERHRQGELYRYLDQSEETMHLALVPGEQAQAVIADLDVAEEVIEETLMGEAYGLHTETGIFCISRVNPMFGESYSGPIPVYRIPGGYMVCALTNGSTESPVNELAGAVEDMYFLGSVVRLRVRVDDQVIHADVFNNLHLTLPGRGQAVTLHFKPEACMIISKNTGDEAKKRAYETSSAYPVHR